MNHALKGYITVTQDIRLASTLLLRCLCDNSKGYIMMKLESKLLLTCAA
ncbi:hypothetical protein [Bacillus sp. MRMR6]|nr:hypothetical protein [Bacillus sp. MRMR6]